MANMCAFVTVFVLHFCLQDQTGSLFEKIVRPFGASEMKQQHTISEEDAEAMQLLLRNGDCGLMNVYFDSLQALGLTGVCFSREDGIFRRQDNRPVTSHCSEHQMKALKAKTVDLDLNNLFLDQTRILNAENLVNSGITVGGTAISTSKLVGVKLWKYTEALNILKHLPNSSISFVKGISLYLNENNGNVNIGHASRDTLFAAHIFRHFHVEHSLIHDKVQAQPTPHRRLTYGALVSELDQPHDTHWLPRETSLPQDRVTCFQVVLQKTTAFPGDFLSRDFLRSAVYNRCNVNTSILRTAVVVEMHHGSRQWSEPTVEYLIESVQRKSWARTLDIIVQDFSKLSPCEQVTYFARSKVLIAHHGAVVQGNGPWLPDGAVLVEIVSQHDLTNVSAPLVPIWASSPVTEFARSTGISAISASVAYSASGRRDYYHDSTTEVLVNISRWEETLEKIDEVIRASVT